MVVSYFRFEAVTGDSGIGRSGQWRSKWRRTKEERIEGYRCHWSVQGKRLRNVTHKEVGSYKKEVYRLTR